MSVSPGELERDSHTFGNSGLSFSASFILVSLARKGGNSTPSSQTAESLCLFTHTPPPLSPLLLLLLAFASPLLNSRISLSRVHSWCCEQIARRPCPSLAVCPIPPCDISAPPGGVSPLTSAPGGGSWGGTDTGGQCPHQKLPSPGLLLSLYLKLKDSASLACLGAQLRGGGLMFLFSFVLVSWG